MNLQNKIGLIILILAVVILVSFVAHVKDLNISWQSYALLIVLITLPSGLGLSFSKSSSKSEIILNVIGVIIITISLHDLFYVYFYPFLPALKNFDYRYNISFLKLLSEIILYQPFLPILPFFINGFIGILYFLSGVSIILFKKKARNFVFSMCLYYLIISILWFLIGIPQFFMHFEELKKVSIACALFHFVYYLKAIVFYAVLILFLRRSPDRTRNEASLSGK